MQFGRLLVAGLLGLGAQVEGRVVTSTSPVTRVVELLKSLAEKTEQEAKAEEELYETFVCWAKSIVSQKKASNAAAEARAEELRTYIDDLENGRVELTSERADLTKQLEELNKDIQAATQLRENEKKDFEVAKDEMQKAVDALTKAVEVLSTATKDHKKGVLLSTKAQIGTSAEARAQEAESLSRAVELGSRVLGQADASFLRRLLTGEVPKADWKKLNRKATFKMDYKARSFKIQDVLAKLLQSFKTDLKEATEKEQAAAGVFAKLMESKGAEKAATEEALQKMAKENGARGMSKEESQEELAALTTQIANDQKYIQQVEDTAAQKKQEWSDRQALRANEQAAISKAIDILMADDARDLFKRSLASQEGASFVQLASASRAAGAAEVLRRAAREGADSRLAALATSVRRSGKNHFAEVVKAIDNMMKELHAEEAQDLKKKEECEANRAKDTRNAALISRAMDDLSESIVAGKTKIAQIVQDIKDKNEQVAATQEELKEAAAMREKEHKEWQVSDKDDKDAKEVVLNARNVLDKFYKDNNLMLAQTASHRRQEPVVSQAGKAPPPPPATWEAPYGGKTDESTGIVSMLDMIAEDIEKDKQKASAEEAEAQAMFEKNKATMEKEVQDLNTAISELTGVKGEAEKDVNEDVVERAAKRGELEVVMKTIRDSTPTCDFFSVNYPVRVNNRQLEMDGLTKAKIILSGGSPPAPKDANREIKPGDAFVQARVQKFLARQTVL